MMTIGSLLNALVALPVASFSPEERALVRKYGTEEAIENEEWDMMFSNYDEDLADYMAHPWYETKLRDNSHAKRHSTISYYKGLMGY